jgi:hypothetical protein
MARVRLQPRTRLSLCVTNVWNSTLLARELLRGQGLERVAKGRTGRDSQLRKGSVEVTDGSVATNSRSAICLFVRPDAARLTISNWHTRLAYGSACLQHAFFCAVS